MIDEFRFRTVGADTALYGVVGNNVSHSLSPVMHNAAFDAARLDAVYVPLCAGDFNDFRTFADALDMSGVSVTIPFKLDALEAAEHADDLARAVGAANTLRRSRESRPLWEATNTDVQGFLDPLEAIYPRSLRGARASVMGAGGAARAVAVALVGGAGSACAAPRTGLEVAVQPVMVKPDPAAGMAPGSAGQLYAARLNARRNTRSRAGGSTQCTT
jgi:shikimate 5-dehydrogenase